MSLGIICVGKLREKYYQDAAEEYAKRLRRFGALDIHECADLSEPKNASEADLLRVLDAEGTSILSHVKPRDHVIALTIGGKAYTSPAFAERLRLLEDRGAGRVIFIIGGSNGLSAAVLARAQEQLSFSPMTFPHQLARVMLLEQLYRARKIQRNETYHK